jgi:FkbM family methyltransferase
MPLQNPSPKHGDFQAQFGEDRLLFKHFAKKRDGYYVEVGGCDGVYASNSYFFEKIGWHGVLVEPIPEMAEKCRLARPGSQVFCCAAVAPGSPEYIDFEVVPNYTALSAQHLHRERWQGQEPPVEKISVRTMTLDQILEKAQLPHIDFLTIDVEGQEWEVLQGFTIDRWRPKLVILERWSEVPDERMMQYMHRNSYYYLRTTGGLNDWFCLSSPQYASSPVYRLRLIVCHYVPSYAIYFLRRTAKAILTKLGLRTRPPARLEK